MQSQPAKDTRQTILDAAETLILTRGYNGFSYKDIADIVGIRKASIHYHFPSKEDLGAVFVDGYFHRFERWCQQVGHFSVAQKLAAFLEMFQRVSNNAERICPLGMLTAEYPTLPRSVQDSLQRLLGAMDHWLTQVLARGQAQGVLRPSPEAPIMAKLMINAISGSMKIARVFQDADQLEQVFHALISMIRLREIPPLQPDNACGSLDATAADFIPPQESLGHDED